MKGNGMRQNSFFLVIARFIRAIQSCFSLNSNCKLAIVNCKLIICFLSSVFCPLLFAQGEQVILDGTGYFRQHIQFGIMKLNSDILKKEGEKLYGKDLRRFEREIKKLLK